MLPDWLGPPQLAAALVLAQRGLEELHSMRNTRRLLAEGAHEEGSDLYPVVASAHLGWIAAIALLIPPSAAVIWPLASAFLALQIARYWVIGSLGRYWTHRIITLPGAPVVRSGPYGLVRHPNYVVTIAETALLPLVFGQVAIAAIFTAIWIAVIRAKISLEDAALAGREEEDTNQR